MGKNKPHANIAQITLRYLSLTAFILGLLWLFFADTGSISALVTNSGTFFYGDTNATTQGYLRARTFTSPATAGTEFNGSTASSTSFVLWTIAKTAPTREETMIGTLKVNGTLDIQTCTTGCDANADYTARWNNAGTTATQDCDSVGTADTCFRAFDIAYESLGGRGLVVYADNTTDSAYYAFWNGSAWSPDTSPDSPSATNLLNLPGTGGTPQWIRVIASGENLDSDRSSRIMVLISDTNEDLHAFYWDGSSFDAGTTLLTDLQNCSTGQCFDAGWQDNDTFVSVFADVAGATADIKYRNYTVGTGWAGSSTSAFTATSAGRWLNAATDPTSTRIFVSTAESGNDTRSAIWRGDDATNGWAVGCADTGIEEASGMQSFTAFERFNGEALHVFNNNGTSSTSNYCTFTPAATWGTVSSLNITTADDLEKIKAWGAPNSDDIMVMSQDVDCDTDAILWTGAALNTLMATIEADNSEYGTACPNLGNPGTPPSGAAMNYDFAWKMYTPWQRNWRFYNGTDTASIPTTALAAENTAPTGFAVDTGIFRLRANYAERGTLSSTDSRRKLQYTSGCNPNSVLETTCTWTDVDDVGSSGIWRYRDPTCTATDCADGTLLTGTVLTGSGACSTGNGCGTWIMDKDAAAGASMDHNGTQVQESEWIVEANWPAFSTTYYFRIWDVDQDTPVYREQDANDCGGGAAACTYPSLTTGTLPPPDASQVMRHGNWFSGGVERYQYWAN